MLIKITGMKIKQLEHRRGFTFYKVAHIIEIHPPV
jgi:hypothetical protein